MRNEYAGKLLARNRVGALMRVFAQSRETMEYQIDSALKAAERLLAVRVDGKVVFSRIDFLVSDDNRFPDTDFGETATYLRQHIRERFPGSPLSVLDVRNGDIYCMLLDYGIVNQMEDRVSYSLIVSHGVSDYITQENIEALLAAMYCKARVAGLAIREVKELVTQGRIQNTCALWHNKSLMTIGGFDLRAAKPDRAHLDSHESVTAQSEEHGELYGSSDVAYVRAGCEEIIPLLRFTKFFGPSIAVILPVSESAWRAGENGNDSVQHKRHLAKLATKEIRQAHMAALEGMTLSVLNRGIVDLHASICNPTQMEM